MHLETKVKATDTSVATLQANLQSTVNAAIRDEDLDLTTISASLADSASGGFCLNHVAGIPLTTGKGSGLAWPVASSLLNDQ